jgi:hypothetical protein
MRGVGIYPQTTDAGVEWRLEEEEGSGGGERPTCINESMSPTFSLKWVPLSCQGMLVTRPERTTEPLHLPG